MIFPGGGRGPRRDQCCVLGADGHGYLAADEDGRDRLDYSVHSIAERIPAAAIPRP